MDGKFVSLVRVVDEFLMGESKVHETLSRLARRLADLDVEFAVAGGLAVGFRGHLRVTVDVDVVITRAGLERFKHAWLGKGYVEKFEGSRGVKDAVSGVPIDFLLTGDYPGDGKPGPVAFPDPTDIPVGKEGFRLVELDRLIELKLASGMTAPDRLIDFADVIALIRANDLGEDFADGLNDSVRDKYRELWTSAQRPSEY